MNKTIILTGAAAFLASSVAIASNSNLNNDAAKTVTLKAAVAQTILADTSCNGCAACSGCSGCGGCGACGSCGACGACNACGGCGGDE